MVGIANKAATNTAKVDFITLGLLSYLASFAHNATKSIEALYHLSLSYHPVSCQQLNA